MEIVTGYAVASDGAYIAYQTYGDGETNLVWQFDWFGNIDALWEVDWLRDWLPGLGTFSRVILHDRRATGLSSRNVPAPNLETRVSDLLAVLDAIGADGPVVVGGFLEGGAPNALLAATFPERVQSLIWVSPSPRSTWTPDYPWGIKPEYVEFERESFAVWGTTEYGRIFAEHLAPVGALTEDDAAWLGKLSRQTCTPDVARALAEIWYQTDVRGALPAIQAPSLLIHTSETDADRAECEYVASLIPTATVRSFPGARFTTSYLDAVRQFLGVEPPRPSLDSLLTTVLFTDIVESTQRQTALGDLEWKALVERHHRVVRHALDRWRGTEDDTAGDGFFAHFDGPARAIHCGIEISERVRDLGLQVRSGIHTGECELIDGKPGGVSVTTAARISALAGPSQVLVSQTVKDLVAGSGFGFDEAGEHELKGIPDRWRLYQAAR
jgi:class 3 adenylate cyclase/pimeloyl-ACP methyl ester carboxylesterase